MSAPVADQQVFRDVIGRFTGGLECEVGETVTGGTHTVVPARVTVASGHDGTPLTSYRGRSGRLESVREEACQAVRRSVLERRRALDQPPEATDVADALGLGPTHVTYAVVRLAGDHAVSRTADSRFVPTPLTVEVDLAVLDGFATGLATVVADDTSTPAQFLDASHGYHRHVVGLAHTPQLGDTDERLGVAALWREAIPAHDRCQKFDVTHHAELTRACRDGDPARARQLIIEHTDQVRGLARDVIDQAGGALQATPSTSRRRHDDTTGAGAVPELHRGEVRRRR